MLLEDRQWGSLVLVPLGFQTNFVRLEEKQKEVMLFLRISPANNSWDLKARPDPF